MAITAKFISALRHFSGKTQVTFDYNDGMLLQDLIAKINQCAPQQENVSANKETSDSVSNALILVNGREISVLNGLQTKLNDGDEVVFIPVVHGG